MTTQSTLLPQSKTSTGSEVVKTILQPPYLPNITKADYFLLQRSEVSAGRPLAVLGPPPQDKSGEGYPNHQKKNESATPTGNGLLRKVHPNWLWLGLKKSRNNRGFKMIHIGYFNLYIWFWKHLVKRGKDQSNTCKTFFTYWSDLTKRNHLASWLTTYIVSILVTNSQRYSILK